MVTVPLSAIDHVYSTDAFDPMPFVFEFSGSLNIHRLVDSFHETARRIPDVTGVLRIIDDRHMGIDISNDSANQIRVVDGEQDRPTAECFDPVRTAPAQPLVRARITPLAGGRTAVALTFAHVVGDGYSFFLFASLWAAIARGEQGFPVNSDRSLLTDSSATQIEFAPGLLPHSGFTLLPADVRPPRWQWQEQSYTPAAKTPNSGLSQNDVICAELWKNAAATKNHTQSTFSCLVDLRRHRKELGPLFFGNAVLVASVCAGASDLNAADTAEVASWIRNAVERASQDSQAGVSELESLRMAHGIDVFRRVRFMDDRGFSVSNLSRLPFNALDFGSGPPTRVEIGGAAYWACMCVVLPGVDALRLLATVE